ncbi:MAG: hypothetical protein HYZ48_00680 [Chlamydiales bacterium]|nr:hypothetical protein [Chlamydiales bacterium]
MLSIRHFISKINPKRNANFLIEKTRAEFLTYRNRELFRAQFPEDLVGDRNRGFNHPHLDYIIAYSDRPDEVRFCAREESLRAAWQPDG